MLENKVKDTLNSLKYGDVKIKGFVGERLEQILDKRVKCDEVFELIYPEILQPFIDKTDEKVREGAGMWQGEFWGKWMMAVISAYHYTGDVEIFEFVKKSIYELLDTQREDGYIGSYEHSDFVIADPKNRKCNWNLWCRKYTLWSLIECYELLGDEKILNSAISFMDQLMTEVGPGKIDIRDTGVFIGLPSMALLKPVVLIYKHTGDKRYLEYAEYIIDQWSLHENRPPDILNKGLEDTPIYTWYEQPQHWAKAYEFLSNLEGLLELYKITEKEAYLTAVTNIYNNIRKTGTTIIGSVSFDDKLVCSKYLINILSEVCDSVHWAKLSTELLKLKGLSLYVDEIEKTMYNVYLGAMNIDSTWGLRRMRGSHVHYRSNRQCGLKAHHCCIDSVTKGFFQLADVALMQKDNSVLVNLYTESDAKVTLPSGNYVDFKINTQYPDSDTIYISVTPEREEEFDIALRIPYWSRNNVVKVNGESIGDVVNGDYHYITRIWKAGDVIELVLDMTERIIDFPLGMVKPEDYQWHRNRWANFGDNEPDNVDQVLPIECAQKFVPAFAVVRGPVVLVRDIRLGDDDIFEKIPLELENKHLVKVRRVESPENIWLAYEVDIPVYADSKYDVKTIKMCNYSSAGNTWDEKTSAFNTWLEIKGF